jgi:asparagine N-glycosylation enzyme membrane subunit Stt3
VAAVAHLFSDRPEAIERVLAVSGLGLGVVATGAVYAATRALASRSVAVGAAFLFAATSIANRYGSVGNGDHHAFVATIAAGWLAAAMHFARGDLDRRATLALAAALATLRAAMLLGWAGSLLYVGIADGVLGVLLVLSGDARRLAAFGAGALASAAIATPVVLCWDEISGGPWSAITLSWLHVAMVSLIGVGSLAVAAVERARPSVSLRARTLRLAALTAFAAFVGAIALGSSLARSGIAGGLRFLGQTDAAGINTYEQLPLFSIGGRHALKPPQLLLGWWVYLLPIAPLLVAALPRARAHRPVALLLAAWSACASSCSRARRCGSRTISLRPPPSAARCCSPKPWSGSARAVRSRPASRRPSGSPPPGPRSSMPPRTARRRSPGSMAARPPAIRCSTPSAAR